MDKLRNFWMLPTEVAIIKVEADAKKIIRKLKEIL